MVRRLLGVIPKGRSGIGYHYSLKNIELVTEGLEEGENGMGVYRFKQIKPPRDLRVIEIPTDYLFNSPEENDRKKARSLAVRNECAVRAFERMMSESEIQ